MAPAARRVARRPGDSARSHVARPGSGKLSRMSGMDRRTFLLHTGRWLAIASLAPFVPGCAQALTSTTDPTDDQRPRLDAGDDGSAPPRRGSSRLHRLHEPHRRRLHEHRGRRPPPAPPAPAPSAAPDLAVAKGEVVEKNLRAAIALLGGMERFVKKDGKVVVKPNVLTGRPPEYATTTSPELMTAVIKMCWEAGAKEVVVFDNPTSNPRAAFETCGLAQAVSDAGAKLDLPERPQLRERATSPRARCSRRGRSSPTP